MRSARIPPTGRSSDRPAAPGRLDARGDARWPCSEAHEYRRASPAGEMYCWAKCRLLGPRPHPIALKEAFAERISPLSRRHKVKPGITGWAQVHGYRGETDTIEKMRRRIECDLYYIDNWSFLLDIKIIVMTLFSSAPIRTPSRPTLPRRSRTA